MASKSNDASSLSYTRWNCKYHIVFIPKYRRKALYGKLRVDIGGILRQLCNYKSVEIIEAHAMKAHIHMLVKIPPKLAVASFMGYLKGKSSLMIFERHANLKYKYGNQKFLGKKLLCLHGRVEYESSGRIYQESRERIYDFGQSFEERICDPPLRGKTQSYYTVVVLSHAL